MRRIPTLLTVLAILVLILLLTVVPAALAQQTAPPPASEFRYQRTLPPQATSEPAPNLNPCTGLPATPPYYDDIDLAKPWPACASPTLPRLDANDKGIVGWRWCKVPSGAYVPQWAVIPWLDLMAQPALALELTAAGLNMNEDALKVVTGKYTALIKPLAHPANAAIWCPLWPKIVATKPAPTPPPTAYTHIVARNSTLALRPTYPVAGGRRSTVSNGLVPVGSDCDITRTVVEGVLTFGYPVAAKPDSVALCVRR